MLNTTYTITTTSSGAPVLELQRGFAGAGAGTVFVGPHPSTDTLASRISMRVSHETSKKEVARSLLQVKWPILDSDDNVVGYEQYSVTVTRPSTSAVAAVGDKLKAIGTLLASGTLALDIAGQEQ